MACVLIAVVAAAAGIAAGFALAARRTPARRPRSISANDPAAAADRAQLADKMVGLQSMSVDDIMIPRGEIAYVDVSDDWDTILDALRSTPHTRLPVCQGNLDNIVGIVHMKKVAHSLAHGEIETTPLVPNSICDGLMARRPGVAPFAALRTAGARGLAVTDASVRKAMKIAAERMKLVLEPSGAASLAALIDGGLDVAGKSVLVIATGGNVSLADFMKHIENA